MSITKAQYLNEDQKKHFIENGFLKLPQAISDELLKQLRAAVDEMCAPEKQILDRSILDVSDQQFVIAIDKIVSKSNPIFVELLGSPLLLSIAESLCGVDFFPVQDFVVIKNLGDQNPVNWHQDVVTKVHEKTFMIGFYLDAATDDNGALRVIPNSHKSNLSICELEKMEYQSLDMEAGGILIHNLKIAHSSGILTSFPKRRVIYFEFMSASEICKERIYPESFVELRTSIIPNAIRCFQLTYPEAASYEWKHLEQSKYPTAIDPHLCIQEHYMEPKKVKAANYCFDFIANYQR